MNTFTTGNQMNPAVAYDANGNFVVVWESNLQDGSVRGVYGQEYDSSGVPLGAEFQVNTHTSLEQDYPAVAAYGDRNFIVSWQSNRQDGDSWGVYGQRYGTAPPPPPIVIDIQVDEVNVRSKGMIPIVIQTTASFDAQDVDPATVRFGPNGAFKAHAVAHLADVDLDGDIDLVVHFRAQQTCIQCGDTEATLTGATLEARPFPSRPPSARPAASRA